MVKKWGLIVAGFVFCLCTGCITNPITGEEQFNLVSPEDELEIGKTYAPEIEKQMGGRIPDESLQNYIDSVGRKIVRVSHRPDLEYHFTALEHKSINAFALPGGYVFVTRGMLGKLTSEAQLSGVLAHEIVHIVAHHASVAMSRQIGIGMLLSVVTPENTSGNILMAADLAQKILDMQFSKEDEQQADLAGLDYVVAAEYNPGETIEVMRMLQHEHEESPIDFFSTHPSPQNRIAYLTQRIQSRYPDVTELKIGKEDYRRAVLKHLNK